MQQSDQIKSVTLRPLKDNDKDFEEIERRIRVIFKQNIYLPLVKLLGAQTKILTNAAFGLLEAIKSGRIQFYRGTFSGRFNATISKELKALGARWERKTGTFKLPTSSLPIDVRNAISASESYFQAKIAVIDRKLAQLVPEEIADQLKIADHFDKTLWKVEKEFKGSLRNLTLTPQLSDEARLRISKEWENNLKLYIKDWTKENIVSLRKDMQESVFAGNRHEAAIKIIKDGYDVSINKAKFLARQETRLLLTKYKQTRYEDAGVNEYKWGMSNNPVQALGAPYKKGQVRHDHGELAKMSEKGQTFRWDSPPITNHKTGARNNPGQDYNCRCFAIPVVKFKRENT